MTALDARQRDLAAKEREFYELSTKAMQVNGRITTLQANLLMATAPSETARLNRSLANRVREYNKMQRRMAELGSQIEALRSSAPAGI